MTALLDTLLYLLLIGIALSIIVVLLCGINNMINRIRRANARLIWRIVARHRRIKGGDFSG